MGDTSVTMRARVEIEITVGTWGDNTNLREMRQQLRREALAIINGKLEGSGVRILTDPKITAIMVEEQAHG